MCSLFFVSQEIVSGETKSLWQDAQRTEKKTCPPDVP